MFLDDLIGQRVSTGFGYGEVIDVTEDEQLVIELDDGDEVTLPPDAVDVMDLDDAPDDDEDDFDGDDCTDEDDFDGDDREFRKEYSDDFEEDA